MGDVFAAFSEYLNCKKKSKVQIAHEIDFNKQNVPKVPRECSWKVCPNRCVYRRRQRNKKRALCQQQATIMLAVVSKNSSISLCLSQSVVSLYLSESRSLYPYAKNINDLLTLIS